MIQARHPQFAFVTLTGLTLILLCVLGVSMARAFDVQQSLSHYSYDVWQLKNGLPQNSVRSIAQSPDGYIWLGTASGLVRFDGVHFTIFKGPTEGGQTGDDGVRRIVATRDGAVWVSANGGQALRWKDGKFTSYTFAAQTLDGQAQPLYEDRAGRLWFGTPRGAVYLEHGKFTTLTMRDGLAGDFVTVVTEDAAGGIWIGTRAGVSRFHDGRLVSFKTSEQGAPLRVTALCLDRAGHMWIGTAGGGLHRYEGEKVVPIAAPESVAFVETIYQDRHGNLWIGTQASGLCRLKDGEFQFVSKPGSLPDTTVQAILEDREGNLWIGTRRGGLVRVKQTKFTTLSTNEGLPDDHVYVIYEEPDRSLWIGTRGGLTLLKNGHTTTYTTKQGLSHNTVRALHKDRAGNLWIGTYGAGVNRFKDSKITTHGRDQGIADVVAIASDARGDLWLAATTVGLVRFHASKFEVGIGREQPALSDIKTIHADRAGQIWIGARQGLVALKDGTFRPYTERDGLSSNSIKTIYEDDEGSLWIGTTKAGLNRLRDGKLTSYTTKNGLPNDAVYQILDDRRGHLWIGSSDGIYRVQKKDFGDFDQRKIRSLASFAYSIADGMKSNECTVNGRTVKAPGASSTLFFPTIMGVVAIDPDRINRNDPPPVVHIEQAALDKHALALHAATQVPPGRGDLEVQYTGLSFVAPERVKFKYLLEGRDREWNEAGTRRLATYTNLPPGHYRFRVIASNNDGVWSEAGAALAFRLRPHFYQTSWFFALCAALTALAGWLLHRLRVRRMEREFAAVLAERTRIARELHDTLLQGFAGTAYSLKAIANIIPAAPETARQYLERALEQVNHCLADARRSVWNLRAEHENESNLLGELTESARQLTANRPIAIEIQAAENSFRLPPTVEANLLRIGQEAIANSVKHARASRIRIELNFDDRCVTLSVRDDGSGFDEQTLAHRKDHFGLRGMRERAKQIGGQLSLHSDPRGTEVLVIVLIR